MPAIVACPSCATANRVPVAATGTPACGSCGTALAFSAGNVPHTVVVDHATRRAFATNKGAATVSVIDLVTGVASQYPVEPNPHGLAIDGRYHRLYVTSIDAMDERTHWQTLR